MGFTVSVYMALQEKNLVEPKLCIYIITEFLIMVWLWFKYHTKTVFAFGKLVRRYNITVLNVQ
jgi:hypothetical protein